MNQQDQTSRRDFMKTSAAAALATGVLATGVHAQGSDEIKVGVIGCGGRGRGAAVDVLRAAKGVTIHALGDVFETAVNGSRRSLESYGREDEVKDRGNKVDVNGRCFHGLDAYKQVVDSGVNYIILASPPGFRPMHIEYAVNAGKNVFTEKPVAVDGPGIRAVFEAEKKSKTKRLGIAAGTQRRHQKSYQEVMKRVHGGEIGEIVNGRCYWMQGILWKRPRRRGMSDAEYQINNWYAFPWLSGDHIVEQHVHNIDVINWALRARPERALGMGYRTRTDPEYGPIYDFFSVEFIYPKNVLVHSACRQISGCHSSVSEHLVGTKGTCDTSANSRYWRINGKSVFERKNDNAPYVQEHTDLIESIRKGQPINELAQVTESTLTAIMGRMSAYTGQAVTWEMALNSKEVLMPENLTLRSELKEPPVAVPGKTKFI